MEKINLTIQSAFPSGMLTISAVVKGHLVRKRYLGYSKTQAKKLFIQTINSKP